MRRSDDETPRHGVPFQPDQDLAFPELAEDDPAFTRGALSTPAEVGPVEDPAVRKASYKQAGNAVHTLTARHAVAVVARGTGQPALF